MPQVTTRFRNTGMHCPSCSMLIQMEVSDLPGVSEVVSDHATSETSVTYDPNVVGIDDIVGAIVKAGYSAEPIDA